MLTIPEDLSQVAIAHILAALEFAVKNEGCDTCRDVYEQISGQKVPA